MTLMTLLLAFGKLPIKWFLIAICYLLGTYVISTTPITEKVIKRSNFKVWNITVLCKKMLYSQFYNLLMVLVGTTYYNAVLLMVKIFWQIIKIMMGHLD